VTKILKSLLIDLNDRLHALDVMENDANVDYTAAEEDSTDATTVFPLEFE
jgi:hypothetical protein